MKIILEGKGDNTWRAKFNKKSDAFKYLFGILTDLWAYYNEKTENYCFDIEDDIIIWTDDNGKKYAPGWHWEEKDNLIMPGGKTFYEMAVEITENN